MQLLSSKLLQLTFEVMHAYYDSVKKIDSLDQHLKSWGFLGGGMMHLLASGVLLGAQENLQ